MTQFNETELTEAVVRSFEDTPDPRAKFLLQELVKSLHDYVSKTGLTFEEWEYAIDFLTRTGQKCTPIRQEFILLSDVLGVSMLVDAVNHREREGATETRCSARSIAAGTKWRRMAPISRPICRGSGCSCRAASPTLRASRWRARRSMSGMPMTMAS